MIDAILHALGHKEGLTIKGNEIAEWPYERPLPTQAEIDQWVADYEATEGKARREKEELLNLRDEILLALYDAVVDSNHAKSQAVKTKVDAIKAKYQG